jgi:pseudouridine-5'-phosphate glycosidase
MNPLLVAPDVQEALASGRPVVALESAVITHGLPADAAIDAVQRQHDACLKAGATPAVVAVFQGCLKVGLTIDECRTLARREGAAKVSPWNLAGAALDPGYGGTTVAATLVAAAMAGIGVMSTGGIGGVHPGGGAQDVSADLTELARRRVCVVCAGPKSTLDARATLERLETLGVPVIGWRSSLLAGFLTTSAGLRLRLRADSAAELAAIVRRHWEFGGAGLVVTQPIASELAIPSSELGDDGAADAHGPERTPAELKHLQARLGHRVVEANVALLEKNATLAGATAVALGVRTPSKSSP